MIRIISGVCRTELGIKRVGDEPFTLTPAAEERLVKRKVAAYVYTEVPVEPVATPLVDQNDDGTGVNTSDAEVAAEGEENATSLGVDQLRSMKLDHLKQLAEDMGIDTEALRTRADYARAIAAVDAIVEPDLTVEGPVE